jgi:hypothetical protein
MLAEFPDLQSVTAAAQQFVAAIAIDVGSLAI